MAFGEQAGNQSKKQRVSARQSVSIVKHECDNNK
jgi:hypothetical protein